MKRETFSHNTSSLRVEFELDECPAVIISEQDFTEHPLYCYVAPKEMAKEFRELADWLETIEAEG